MQKGILNTIQSPADLKKISVSQLPEVALALRNFIINAVATKEGHLGASLGVVELTIALHYIFSTPIDKLIWDVGHQAYGHKILTGRKDVFHTNRQFKGISGFPKMDESEYDAFGTGHSSTAISAILGMAMAAKLRGEKRQHIAVVGDASIASGMAFEALNHAGISNTNVLIILNDNAIGIDPSVGALKQYFSKVNLGTATEKDNIFEALQFHYTGPVDGHNISELLKHLSHLKTIDGPKVLHLITKKGKGLKQAEENQVAYHAPGKFDPISGDLPIKSTLHLPVKYQDIFGKTLVELAATNDKIIGITPAMPSGSSLKYMMEAFPDRAFDVGIAEQHAVTFAAGLASEGFNVFCTIYSTFLQRGYDQLIHDVSLQNIPVIFCVDRAGLVGADGATHHGIFDIPFLRCIPNLVLASPSNGIALRNLLYTAQATQLKHPLVIRYPRGESDIKEWQVPFQKIIFGKGNTVKVGTKIAILSIGTIIENANKAVATLNTEEQTKVGIFDMAFIKPLDTTLLQTVFKNYETVITLEDGVVSGGFGTAVLEFAVHMDYKNPIYNLGIKDYFPQHGPVEELQDEAGISSSKIALFLKRILQ